MPKPEAPQPPPVIEDPDIGVRLARRWPRLFGWLEHVNESPYEKAAGTGKPVHWGNINPPPTGKRPKPPPAPPPLKNNHAPRQHSHHKLATLMHQYETSNGVGGLSDGISADFATEVAMQYAEWYASQ